VEDLRFRPGQDSAGADCTNRAHRRSDRLLLRHRQREYVPTSLSARCPGELMAPVSKDESMPAVEPRRTRRPSFARRFGPVPVDPGPATQRLPSTFETIQNSLPGGWRAVYEWRRLHFISRPPGHLARESHGNKTLRSAASRRWAHPEKCRGTHGRSARLDFVRHNLARA